MLTSRLTMTTQCAATKDRKATRTDTTLKQIWYLKRQLWPSDCVTNLPASRQNRGDSWPWEMPSARDLQYSVGQIRISETRVKKFIAVEGVSHASVPSELRAGIYLWRTNIKVSCMKVLQIFLPMSTLERSHSYLKQTISWFSLFLGCSFSNA
jgi:hypothetical protein